MIKNQKSKIQLQQNKLYEMQVEAYNIQLQNEIKNISYSSFKEKIKICITEIEIDNSDLPLYDIGRIIYISRKTLRKVKLLHNNYYLNP